MYPFVSKGAGIHPAQIPEAKKLFPHHDYVPETGDMVFNSKPHREQCLRDVGLVDFDGNQSGRN